MKALNPSTGNLETVYVKALDSMPVGIIVEFPTTDSSQLPAGYMFCDGSEVSRTTYSKLFEVIGTKFGAGDGSTTFNLPSKEGLVTAGIKSSDTDFDTIGETVGNKTNNLSNVWAEIGYYENRILMNTQDGAINVNRDMACSSGTGISTQIGNHTKVSGSVSTLQPTIVSNFIIKVSETRALAGTILNAQNSSTTDTYSCDYINKLNTYSTTEQKVGTWINNKPIYRQVFSFTLGSSVPADYAVANMPSNYEQVTLLYAMANITGGNQTPVPISWNNALDCGIMVQNNRIYIRPTWDAFVNATGYVILEYTKTTD